MKDNDNLTLTQSQLALRQLQHALVSDDHDRIDYPLLDRLRERLARIQRLGGDYRFVAFSQEASQLIEPKGTVIAGMDSTDTVQPRNKTLYS